MAAAGRRHRAVDLAQGALARLSLDRGGPRDLAAIRDGVFASNAVARILKSAAELPAGLALSDARLRVDCGDLEGDLRSMLADDLPLVRRDGVESWPRVTKYDVGQRLAEAAVDALSVPVISKSKLGAA